MIQDLVWQAIGDQGEDFKRNGFEDESFQRRGRWYDSESARNRRAIARFEEHQRKVAGFKKMIQDLAWQVIGDQEEDLKKSKTVHYTVDGRVLAKKDLKTTDLLRRLGLDWCLFRGVLLEVWRISEDFASLVDSPLGYKKQQFLCLCSSNSPKQPSKESSGKELHLGSE
ncbi:hypothetical protein M9H77_18449 [Catharanthus roseus]|uniref:Uncharacterized protein n=1 Tax=Catharanthus roseus TaxID=4058 RepID=A0ACC0B7H3_CATRO|nr:hypothetical protein M9H77_18449 [Catharanthus roseus]